MPYTYPFIYFRSDAFPERPGEADSINPGLFGEALAEFLAQELKAAGFPVGAIFAEDLAMSIPIANEKFSIYVNCVNEDETTDEFRIMFDPDKPTITKWFKKIDTRQVMEPLITTVRKILTNHAQVSDVREQD